MRESVVGGKFGEWSAFLPNGDVVCYTGSKILILSKINGEIVSEFCCSEDISCAALVGLHNLVVCFSASFCLRHYKVNSKQISLETNNSIQSISHPASSTILDLKASSKGLWIFYEKEEEEEAASSSVESHESRCIHQVALVEFSQNDGVARVTNQFRSAAFNKDVANPLRCVAAVSRNGMWIAVSYGRNVTIINSSTTEVVEAVSKIVISSLCFTTDNKLVAGDCSGRLNFWILNNADNNNNNNTTLSYVLVTSQASSSSALKIPMYVRHWHSHPVEAIDESLNGLIISGGVEGVIVIWNNEVKNFISNLSAPIAFVAASPTGPYVIVVLKDNSILLCDISIPIIAWRIDGLICPLSQIPTSTKYQSKPLTSKIHAVQAFPHSYILYGDDTVQGRLGNNMVLQMFDFLQDKPLLKLNLDRQSYVPKGSTDECRWALSHVVCHSGFILTIETRRGFQKSLDKSYSLELSEQFRHQTVRIHRLQPKLEEVHISQLDKTVVFIQPSGAATFSLYYSNGSSTELSLSETDTSVVHHSKGVLDEGVFVCSLDSADSSLRLLGYQKICIVWDMCGRRVLAKIPIPFEAYSLDWLNVNNRLTFIAFSQDDFRVFQFNQNSVELIWCAEKSAKVLVSKKRGGYCTIENNSRVVFHGLEDNKDEVLFDLDGGGTDEDVILPLGTPACPYFVALGSSTQRARVFCLSPSHEIVRQSSNVKEEAIAAPSAKVQFSRNHILRSAECRNIAKFDTDDTTLEAVFRSFSDVFTNCINLW